MSNLTEEELAEILKNTDVKVDVAHSQIEVKNMVDMAADQRAIDHIRVAANPLPRIAAAVSKNKYHAQRTYSELCQRTFDSKAEARRGEELILLLKAGQIDDLRYQVSFKLCEEPKITVTIDFAYLENGKRIYEDVKGVLTRDSRTKYAWLKQLYGIEVRLVR